MRVSLSGTHFASFTGTRTKVNEYLRARRLLVNVSLSGKHVALRYSVT
jgi:hypothetical protein